MKIVFTPHCGSFKESYEKRKEFNTINSMIEYLIKYQETIINKKTIKIQYHIEWYGFSENLKKDRFIIVFKDYKKDHIERYAVGFFHYEKNI